MNAVALNALAMTTSMILSAPLVKIAGDLYDFEGVYGVQVIMLVLGLLVVRRMRTPEVKEAPRRRLLQETASALRHVVSDIRLRVLFLLLAVAALSVNTAVMVTMQAKLKEELLRDSGDMAYLLAVMALGIAITSVIVMRQGDMKRKGGKFQRAMMCGSAIVACMGQASSFSLNSDPSVLSYGSSGGRVHHNESRTHPIEYSQGPHGKSYGPVLIGSSRSDAPGGVGTWMGGIFDRNWQCHHYMWGNFTHSGDLDSSGVSDGTQPGLVSSLCEGCTK